MNGFEFLEAPLIILLAVVAPVWIIAHYVTRWRTVKSLSSEDETMLSDLWESATKMESRIAVLERILDAEAPGWRNKP